MTENIGGAKLQLSPQRDISAGGTDAMTGLVLKGSRNVFIVRANGEDLECRIKEKILKGMEGYYNPFAPGDTVNLDRDPRRPGRARSRCPAGNRRRNWKNSDFGG